MYRRCAWIGIVVMMLELSTAGGRQAFGQPDGIGADRAEPAAAEADSPETAPRDEAESTESVTVAADPPADPDLVTIELMDGSVIAGRLSVDEIVVETKFGTLKVPVTSLVTVTPGLASHPDLKQRIESLVEDLGSEEFPKREQAQKALMSIGEPARSALTARAKDTDAERQKRVKLLLESLDELRDEEFEESAQVVEADTVETTEFTIVGRIVTDSFEIRSRYGTLTARLSDLRKLNRETGEKSDIRTRLSVEGVHLVQRTFKDSRIRVEAGNRITINADGTIIMTPWGNIPCTPDGNQNQFGWYINNEIPAGALVARIGRSGKVVKVGSDHSFTARETGNLYFAIAMNPGQAGNNFPGKYNLRIRVQRD